LDAVRSFPRMGRGAKRDAPSRCAPRHILSGTKSNSRALRSVRRCGLALHETAADRGRARRIWKDGSRREATRHIALGVRTSAPAPRRHGALAAKDLGTPIRSGRRRPIRSG
jgi:hypothetical protein